MVKTLRPAIASLALVTLAACGGGSGSGSGKLSSDAVKYNSLANEYNDYLEEYNLTGDVTPAEVTGTPIAQMPTNGTAHYRGVGVVDATFIAKPLGENKALGDARLTANFGKGTLTGNVTNFKTNKGNATSGQLSVNSTINGNDLVGRTTGSVVLDGENYQIDHRNTGVFLDDDADTVAITSTDQPNRFGLQGVQTTIIAETD